MAVESPGMTNLKTQEIIFLGNLFLHPELVPKYLYVLTNNSIFTTQPASNIWTKTLKYFMKYNGLPEQEIWDSVYSEKELPDLADGMMGAAEDSGRNRFILDKFNDTIQYTLMKNLVAQMENKIAHAEPLENIVGVLNEKWGEIGRVHSAQSISVAGEDGNVSSDLDILEAWSRGELRMQSPRLPVPIPGMAEIFDGTPAGSVNLLIAGFGVGKSSTLAAMAEQWRKTGHVLYITLEMPASSIHFKMLANRTRGLVSPDYVFMKPDELSDTEYCRIVDLHKNMKTVDEYKVFFVDEPAGTLRPAQVGMRVNYLKFHMGIDIKSVIIDYTALMRTNSGAGQEQVGWGYVGKIIEELSGVAKQYGLNIWTAAQAGGDGAHTISDNGIGKDFKPLRGSDLYGSKEVLHGASVVFGLSVMRGTEAPEVAVGTLSTIKNRYGKTFNDYLAVMNYGASSITVEGVLGRMNNAELIGVVQQRLRREESIVIQQGRLKNNKALKMIGSNTPQTALSRGIVNRKDPPSFKNEEGVPKIQGVKVDVVSPITDGKQDLPAY